LESKEDENEIFKKDLQAKNVQITRLEKSLLQLMEEVLKIIQTKLILK